MNSRWSIALLSLLLAAMPVRGQSPAPASWHELESRWNDAHLRGDVEALAELWADDLVIIVPRMQPMDKGSSLGFWRKVPVKFTRYDSSDVKANVLGATAVITGTLFRARDFGGRIAAETWQFTKVYAQRDGKWRVVAFHASEAPQ